MRSSTLVVSLSAIGLLAACSHRERVVERPVVEKQTVIERTVPVVPAAGATVPPSCASLVLVRRHGLLRWRALVPERPAVPLQQRHLEPDARLLLVR
jgi:hypothetical protein